jgi:hypothetical protein
MNTVPPTLQYCQGTPSDSGLSANTVKSPLSGTYSPVDATSTIVAIAAIDTQRTARQRRDVGGLGNSITVIVVLRQISTIQ